MSFHLHFVVMTLGFELVETFTFLVFFSRRVQFTTTLRTGGEIHVFDFEGEKCGIHCKLRKLNNYNTIRLTCDVSYLPVNVEVFNSVFTGNKFVHWGPHLLLSFICSCLMYPCPDRMIKIFSGMTVTV